MKTFLFVLDNPSEIVEDHVDDFLYAFIPCDISKELESGSPVVMYYTEDDLKENKGVYTYLDDIIADNIFEYTVKVL